MSRNPSKIYGHHVANLRELEVAINHIKRLARAEIASEDQQKSLRSLLRLYSFLIGAWIEVRLKKLLHEEFGFSVTERNQIGEKSSQLEQWQETVDLAFRKHHSIKNAKLDKRSLGIAHAARRDALHDVLSNELKILIEIRNKLAHGQWVYPFNSEGTSVETEKYQLINKENLQSLQLKFSLAGHLANVIHDLVVSPVTFIRDFEDHFKKLLQVRKNLETKDYEKYKKNLIKNRKESRALRKLK